MKKPALAAVIVLSACTDVSGSYQGTFSITPNGGSTLTGTNAHANVSDTDPHDIELWFDHGSCLVQGAETSGDSLTYRQASGYCDVRSLNAMSFDIDSASGSVANDQLVLTVAGGYPVGFTATFMGGFVEGTR